MPCCVPVDPPWRVWRGSISCQQRRSNPKMIFPFLVRLPRPQTRLPRCLEVSARPPLQSPHPGLVSGCPAQGPRLWRYMSNASTALSVETRELCPRSPSRFCRAAELRLLFPRRHRSEPGGTAGAAGTRQIHLQTGRAGMPRLRSVSRRSPPKEGDGTVIGRSGRSVSCLC